MRNFRTPAGHTIRLSDDHPAISFYEDSPNIDEFETAAEADLDAESGAPDNGDADRDALIARAAELDITVGENWKTETIAAKIAAAEADLDAD